MNQSTLTRFVAICPVPSENGAATRCCSFRIVAGQRKSGMFKISKLDLAHSPSCPQSGRRIPKTVIMAATADTLNNIKTVTPTDVMALVRSTHAITPSYSTAWRALSALTQSGYALGAESFRYIPTFFEEIKRLNPGTIAKVEIQAGRFYRAFLCLKACQDAACHCFPVEIMDACHVKSKFGGVLLGLCVIDCNSQLVPLAIGIAEIENAENWSWFMDLLKQSIPALTTPGRVVMHDREKGMEIATAQIRPEAFEANCVFHIEKNVNFRFKTKLGGKVWAVARASTIPKFEQEMEKMNPNAASYLMTCPWKWTRAHFPVPRYGIDTSNALESMNSWLSELRELPHLDILVNFVHQVGTLFYTRRQKYANSEGSMFSAEVYRKYNALLREGQRRQVVPFSENVYSVSGRNQNEIRIVNLEDRTCTCGTYQEYQFPCLHAAAAINYGHRLPENYMNELYLMSSLRNVYQGVIIPIDKSTLITSHDVAPPVITRKAGRPRKVRIRSRGETPEDSRVHCNQCHQKGHNKATCARRGNLHTGTSTTH